MNTTQYGFQWGPLEVTRIAHFEPRKGRECYVLAVETEHGALNVYVSKTGRSMRVFREGKELK